MQRRLINKQKRIISTDFFSLILIRYQRLEIHVCGVGFLTFNILIRIKVYQSNMYLILYTITFKKFC